MYLSDIEQSATDLRDCGQSQACDWCLVLGAWCLVLGAWCLVLGAWCLVLGAWCLGIDV
jgi:hypothetical protein